MTVFEKISKVKPLSEEQIKHFYEKGWVGPLDAFSLEQVNAVRECIKANSKVATEISGGKQALTLYNNVLNAITIRDHHLFHQPISSMLKHENIVGRLNQLGDENLLLWRSDIFCLIPNQGYTKWHQYKEYYWMCDVDYDKPTLAFPADRTYSNFSVSVALEDIPPEKGALRFANGTHKKKFKVLSGSLSEEEGIFANYRTHKSVFKSAKSTSGTFDFNEEEWELETVPAKAGQIIIFTESLMHRALSNTSTENRFSCTGSYINPRVAVYPHRLKGDFIDQNNHNIRRHFCMLVSGKDDFGVNVVRDNHDLSEIEVAFQTLSNLVRYDHVELPQNKQQFEIFALEKQAIEGDCKEEEPDSMLHPRQYIQWQTWKQYQGMSQEEAMKKYIELVDSLPKNNLKQNKTESEIQTWLVNYTAEWLNIEPKKVDVTTDLDSYGLDSMLLVNLIGELEDLLECQLESSILSDYSTIKSLASYLAKEVK